jgi:hypothetical protein
MQYLYAFLGSGLLCLLAQLLLVNTKLGFVNTLIIAICAGVVLTFFGIMAPIVEFGGGGIIVSITDAGEAIFLGLAALLNGEPARLVGFLTMVAGVFISSIIFGLAKRVKPAKK